MDACAVRRTGKWSSRLLDHWWNQWPTVVRISRKVIALDDTTSAGAVQPQEILRDYSITRQLLRTGIKTTQRNLFGYRWSNKGPRQIEADTLEVGWHPRMWSGGGANARAPEVYRGLIDGDELTAAYSHNARFDGRPNSVNFITLTWVCPCPLIASFSFSSNRIDE